MPPGAMPVHPYLDDLDESSRAVALRTAYRSLVARGIVMFTDLPPIAQRKLLERRKIREQRDTAAAAAQGTGFAVDSDELI